MVGLAVVLFFVALALFAPWTATHDRVATSWGAIRKPPSATCCFGTDELGRDVPLRVVWGTQASLLAGVVSVGISLLLGVPIGLLAGIVGGCVDALIARITDAFRACPFLILAIALAAFLGPSLTNAMIAIGVSATPVFLRLTRGQVLAVKVEGYVEAARAVGNPPWRVALEHMLPNVTAPLIVLATLATASAVIAEAVDLRARAVVQPARRQAARRVRPAPALSAAGPRGVTIAAPAAAHRRVRTTAEPPRHPGARRTVRAPRSSRRPRGEPAAGPPPGVQAARRDRHA